MKNKIIAVIAALIMLFQVVAPAIAAEYSTPIKGKLSESDRKVALNDKNAKTKVEGLSMPTITSPTNEWYKPATLGWSYNSGDKIVFKWNNVSGASTYHYKVLQLSGEPDPDSTGEDYEWQMEKTENVLSVTVPGASVYGGYWYKFAVASVNSNGETWNAGNVYVYIKIDAPTVTSPKDEWSGSTAQGSQYDEGDSITFKWKKPDGYVRFDWSIKKLKGTPNPSSDNEPEVPGCVWKCETTNFTGTSTTLSGSNVDGEYWYKFAVGAFDKYGRQSWTYVYVKVLETVNYYTVKFVDWDGTLLKKQTVEEGYSATPPSNPSRTGYTFSGWDKPYTNVTSDLTVTALYDINTYKVRFQDWDGRELKTETVNYGGSATPPVNPTREGYVFTGWDKAFDNVTSNLTITAQYYEDIKTYTVVFQDWDGKELKTETVKQGESATPPADPIREGYTFTGWDNSYTNVTSNLFITAQYTINTYTVIFQDWDGRELKTETVNHGQSANPPSNPTREGYTFIGWDKSFDNVTSNLTVTAQYKINTYTVTFQDWDGRELKTESVSHGGNATPPADPVRDGYVFKGWDKPYTNVTTNLVITAEYTKNTVYYTVIFCDWDGTQLDTQRVEEGGTAIPPTSPSRIGYTFTGWDKSYTNVLSDLTITAQYRINVYTVTFADSINNTAFYSTTVEHGKDAQMPTPPTHVGYAFKGWDNDGKNITADITITALYKRTDIPAYAPQFIVSNAQGRAGETVTVTVSVKNNPGFTTADLYFTYDSSVLELTTAPQAGSAISGCQIITPPAITTIPYHVVIVNGLADVTNNGDVLILTFLIKENAPEGAYTIDLDVGLEDTCNVNGDFIEFAAVAGNINVIEYTLGDVNGDGKVNTRDAVLILQYFAGWDIQVDMKASDVNSDGKVNTRDAVLILQYFAGWDNTPLS